MGVLPLPPTLPSMALRGVSANTEELSTLVWTRQESGAIGTSALDLGPQVEALLVRKRRGLLLKENSQWVVPMYYLQLSPKNA